MKAEGSKHNIVREWDCFSLSVDLLYISICSNSKHLIGRVSSSLVRQLNFSGLQRHPQPAKTHSVSFYRALSQIRQIESHPSREKKSSSLFFFLCRVIYFFFHSLSFVAKSNFNLVVVATIKSNYIAITRSTFLIDYI